MATVIANDVNNQSGASNSGNTNTFTVDNASNTANSTAVCLSSVGGSSAGDAVHQSTVSGVTTWSWGIDNSVTSPTADPFVISQGSALGTNNVVSIATSGEANYPLQPCFLAVNSSDDNNVTGDGTTYTVICDNEIYDQNSDYNNSTGVFTAPVTGRYFFNAGVTLSGILSGNTQVIMGLVASNRTMRLATLNEVPIITSTIYTVTGSTFVDMDAADTASVSITVSSGTKVVDVLGTSGSTELTYFGGHLVC